MDSRADHSSQRIVPLVSVVVPVYKTKDTLPQTLRSVQNQTLRDIEIILVDDGCPDGSVSASQSLIDADPRVRVIEKENGGLSSARNLGAQVAKGCFLYFLDSDDLIAPRALEISVYQAIDHNADCVIFRGLMYSQGFYRNSVFYDWRVWESLNFDVTGSTALLNWSNWPVLVELEPQIGLKLFNRKFFIDAAITFPDGLHYEDMPIHVAVLTRAKRIACCDAELFYYRTDRPGKITLSKSHRRMDILAVLEECLNQIVRREGSERVSTEEGGHFLLAIMRMVAWCEEYLPEDLREEFVLQLFQIFDNVPKGWIEYAMRQRTPFVGRHVRICLICWGKRKEYLSFSRSKQISLAVLKALVSQRNPPAILVQGAIKKFREKVTISLPSTQAQMGLLQRLLTRMTGHRR